MSLSLWLLQFARDPSRHRGWRELTLFSEPDIYEIFLTVS